MNQTSIEMLSEQQTKTREKALMLFSVQQSSITVSQPHVDTLRSPRWLHRVIGSVLLRIERNPIVHVKKNPISRVDLRYMFPAWVLNRCVRFVTDLSDHLYFHLSVNRVRRDLNGLWQQPGSATVEEVREAFAAGKASPLEMDGLGYTILSVSTFPLR